MVKTKKVELKQIKKCLEFLAEAGARWH